MMFIKKIILYLVLLTIAIILPLLWLPKGYVFLSEEDNFANFQNVIYRNLYSWAPPVNNGQPVTLADQATIVPNGIIYYLLSEAGYPNDIIQKIYLSFTIFFTFVAIGYFLSLFTRNNLIILAGILFYYLNFYVWSTLFYSAKMTQLILMPLFFTYFYKFLKTKNYKYAVYNFIALFIFQPIFTNLPAVFVTFAIYPLSLIYFIIESRLKFHIFLKSHWRPITTFFLLILPILMYYAVVVYFSFIFDQGYSRLRNVLTFSSIGSAISLILQFRGSWWEFASTAGMTYNPWLRFYSHPAVVFSSFVLVILSLSLFVKKSLQRIHLFWLIVLLISIFFASGTSFYPKIYRGIYDHLPFFYIFREPWAKFTPLLLFSLTTLLVLSLENLKKYKNLLIVACLILIIFKGFPFFSDKFINNVSRRWNIPFVKIPTYWMEYGEWSKDHQDKKILSIPINYFKRQWYKEHIGNIDHQLARLFGYSHVIYNLSNSNFGAMLEYFIKTNNHNFYKVASIDYALVQKDVYTDPVHYSSKLRTYNLTLQNQLVDKVERNFENKLFLYTIKPEFKIPQIYSAKNIITLPVTINDSNALKKLATTLSRQDYKIGSAIFFTENHSKINKLSQKKIDVPTLEYKKLTPVEYEIKVNKVKNNFILIFNESFNRHWILSIPNAQHSIANGYANAWLLDVSQICKTTKCLRHPDGTYAFNFTINYWPQRIFFLALSLVMFSIVVCLVYPLYRLIKIDYN